MPFGTGTQTQDDPTAPVWTKPGGSWSNPQGGWADLGVTIEKLLAGGGQMATGLANEENRRHDLSTQTISDALAKSSGPAWTEADTASAYGRNADEAAGGYLKNVGNLNDILGGAGHTGGGMGAALAANYDLARVGQILSANRSTQLEAVKLNANKKMQDFNNTLALAQSQAQGPSLIGMDWLSNVLEVRMDQQAASQADKAAKRAANASKTAGLMSGIGSLLGAGIGAL